MHYAMEKGQYEQVTSDATLSLKSAAAKGAMENLMFDPELYKCHHEVILMHLMSSVPSSEVAILISVFM